MSDFAAAIRRLVPVAGARPRSLPPVTRHKVLDALSVTGMSPEARRVNSSSYQTGMDELAGSLAGDGVTQEYLDFLAAHSVPDDVVDRVRSGQLDMSPDAREQRAYALGFMPGQTVYRWDDPGKSSVLGRLRNGLVYASFTPEMAQEAAQNAYAMYPLWGARHVAGLDRAPRPMDVDDLLGRLRRLDDSTGHYQWHNFIAGADGLATSQRTGVSVPVSAPQDDSAWYQLPAVRYGTLERGGTAYPYENVQESHPQYGKWGESASLVPEMKQMGYQGILVSDEGPRSIAYFGSSADGPMPSVRHSGLSVLDPEYRYRRNIFMSLPFLLAPQANDE